MLYSPNNIFQDFWKEQNLNKSLLYKISMVNTQSSIQILHNLKNEITICISIFLLFA